MLTNLKIKNFKCFNSLSLPLAPLTLLTGLNAAGKSTTLQSLLLLAQGLKIEKRYAVLPLNGPLVRLGTPGEILNSGSGHIKFTLESQDAEFVWKLRANDRTHGISLQILDAPKDKLKESPHSTNTGTKVLESDGRLGKLYQSLQEVIYLSATRMGTADVFPAPEGAHPIFADVGVNGEFAPWWFHKHLDDDVDDARCNPNDKAKTLRRQFNAWASELFPGAQGNVQAVEKTNLYRLELRLGDTGDWRRPSNIGYGLTYSFPIIIAGLLAKQGQLLIIDSPEAHLHPKGQSRMGYFLAKMAAAGVQIFIETHSDHLLNGVRLAIGEQKVLRADQACVHFFDTGGTPPAMLKFSETGSISHWPPGFFDQYQLDIRALTRVRRPRSR